MKLNTLVSRYREWRKVQSAIHELQQLNTHELDDIGISRWSIPQAVRHGRSF